MEDLTTVVVSGYFDPLHVGHIEYLELAKSLGDVLVVIVNNDKQAALKKGKSFMNEEDRLTIVSSLKPVDHVFLSIDEGKDVCKSLAYIDLTYSQMVEIEQTKRFLKLKYVMN